MGKLYLFNVYTFCKSLYVINVGSTYGLHGIPMFILYLYDQLWLVGSLDTTLPLQILQFFNYKYMFLMTNVLIIIIGLLVYNYFIFLLYSRLNSSLGEHENLRSKVVLMSNSNNFFKIHFLKCVKNKITNKCSFHLPKSRFIGKSKINNKK